MPSSRARSGAAGSLVAEDAIGRDRTADSNGSPANGRKDIEAADTLRSVDAEVAPVEREDAMYTFPLGHPHKSGVGQVHRQVVILPHQLPHARRVVDGQWQDP